MIDTDEFDMLARRRGRRRAPTRSPCGVCWPSWTQAGSHLPPCHAPAPSGPHHVLASSRCALPHAPSGT